MLKYITTCQIYTCQSPVLWRSLSVSENRMEAYSAGFSVELHFISLKYMYFVDTADYASQNYMYELQLIGLYSKIAIMSIFYMLDHGIATRIDKKRTFSMTMLLLLCVCLPNVFFN